MVSLVSFAFGSGWWHRSIEISTLIYSMQQNGLKGKFYHHEIVEFFTFLSVFTTVSYQICRVFICLEMRRKKTKMTNANIFATESTNNPNIVGWISSKILFSLAPIICYSLSIYCLCLFSPKGLDFCPVIYVLIVGTAFADMATQLMICHICKIEQNPSKFIFTASIVLFNFCIVFMELTSFRESVVLYAYSSLVVVFMSIKNFSTWKEIAHILGIYVFRTHAYKRVMSKEMARSLQMSVA